MALKTKTGSALLIVGLSTLLPACGSEDDSGANGDGAGNSSGMGTGGNGQTGGIGGSSYTGTGGLPDNVPPSPPGSCGLENPAFCERFDTAHPGGRGGDLDEATWSFARWGHETRQFFVRVPANQEPDHVFPSTFCNEPFMGLVPPNDAAICDGIGVDGLRSAQFNEVFDDQGDFAFNSFRARQLFDFTDRTGKVVWDVDAKINPFNLGHGWWFEIFITDDAGPMPYHEAPGVLSYPKNGVGLAFQGFGDCPESGEVWTNELNRVFVSNNYAIVHDYPAWELEFDDYDARCFRVADGKLNHFELLISKDRLELWVGDYDDPTNLRRIASAEPLDLSFTRGYIHLQHAHYNARKDGGVTGVQTYRWDNVGFDGPAYAAPRAYEAPDNTEPDIDGAGGVLYGYYLKGDAWVTVEVPDVEIGDANRATFDFNLLASTDRALEYSFNGGPQHSFTVPDINGEGLRGFSVPVPLEELVDGTNTIELKMAAPQTYPQEVIGNMEITLEKGN